MLPAGWAGSAGEREHSSPHIAAEAISAAILKFRQKAVCCRIAV